MRLLTKKNARRRSRDRERSAGYRPDIQGLRTIAVLLVVLDHLVAWPSGGFVGVDVFFVISGFLITGRLLREGDKYGKIPLGNFYRLRARRILPMALLVLLVTVAASSMLFLGSRAASVYVDAGWAAVFAVNWRFAAVGTDYFQSALPPSPLQHYWSLAVEEQFYIVWPLIIGVVLLISRKFSRGLDAHRSIMFAAVGIIGGSFAWAIYESTSNPTVAYFSSVSRAWELAVGALIAVSASALSGTPRPLRNVLAATGIVGIFGSAVLITPQMAFPAPVGAAPVISTALVIAAGVGSSTTVAASKVLGVRPMVYVGTLSYSLYLWHWPVIILLAAVLDEGLLFNVVAIATMSALTVCSYHLIENPILQSDFLPLKKVRRRRRKHISRQRDGLNKDTQVVLLGGALAGLLALTAVALQPVTPPPAAGPTAVLAAGDSRGDGSDPLVREIRLALDAEEYPSLNPPLDDLDIGRAVELEPESQCMNPPTLADPTLCTYGPPDAARSIVVVGDSIAVSWMPGVRAALEPQGYTIHGIALSSCPFLMADITLENDPAAAARCNASRTSVVDQINALRPDVVVMSDVEQSIRRIPVPSSPTAWQAARTSAMAAIAPSGARVVILSPNPAGTAPAECASAVKKPSACTSQPSPAWTIKREADQAAARSFSGAKFVDTSSWFCVQGQCPIFVAGQTVRWDNAHVTSQYAQFLAPKIGPAILDPPTSR